MIATSLKKPGGIHLTPEGKIRLRLEYWLGANTAELSSRFGITPMTVWRNTAKLGISRNSDEVADTSQIYDQLRALYFNEAPKTANEPRFLAAICLASGFEPENNSPNREAIHALVEEIYTVKSRELFPPI